MNIIFESFKHLVPTLVDQVKEIHKDFLENKISKEKSLYELKQIIFNIEMLAE